VPGSKNATSRTAEWVSTDSLALQHTTGIDHLSRCTSTVGCLEEGDVMTDSNTLVKSYLKLRSAIGYLGIGLPIVLPVGVLVLDSDQGWQATISDYIGTIMRGVFVGILFAIGVFLYYYEGYEPDDDRKPLEFMSDNLAGNLACVFALGVALFPTNSGVAFVRGVHVVAATAMFLTLAYFSLVLFTKSGGDPTPRKMQRNLVYRVSGWTILGCIALIAINGLFFRDTALADIKPVFWLESIALWAFGAAWFVKGEGLGLLTDE
jgi:hypothetical protein